jgi:hypothetical protein
VRAHENPFRTSRAQSLAFRGVVSHDQIAARLANLGYRGAIIGREGSGKSTLLRELERDLSAEGLSTKLVQFDDRALLRRVERDTILMVDGAEKIPWPLHLILTLTTPRLVVTAHGRREGLPVLVECAATPELMDELLTELAGPDPALAARARHLFHEKRGNIRQVFSALYDVLAKAP